MSTITISLPPALKKFVKECVANGRYADSDAVINHAVAILKKSEERCQSYLDQMDATLIDSRKEMAQADHEIVAQGLMILDKLDKEIKPRRVEVTLDGNIITFAERYGKSQNRTLSEQINLWCHIALITQAHPRVPFDLICEEYGMSLDP
uniref:Uncharacterized protein n=1 Tax=Magnetococcus massalia (strain MO-1) TaxID=451514 RepID=A0A1S7LIJ6_MAGMO|nr:protein of unknown function [Candidatus Magnetococcus massalia]